MRLSSFLNLLLDKTKKISHHKYWWVVLGIILLYVIILNGISLVPYQTYQKLSQNPFIIRTDLGNENYWQETVLLPVIAYITRMNSTLTFTIVCLLIIIGSFILFTVYLSKHSSPLITIIVTTILITNPLSTILFTWLGTPDGLTFFLTIPFLFTNSIILLFFLIILGTMNHITFLIAAIEILFLRFTTRENIKNIHLATITIGGVIGLVLVKVFYAVYQIQAITRFEKIFTISLADWIRMNLGEFPLTIFSLFNFQWLIIPVCLILFFKKNRLYYSIILGLLIFNYGITFFAEDTTRIFTLLSWGILIHCVIYSSKLASIEDLSFQNQFLEAMILIAIISLISPRYYSFAGNIFTTPFYSFLYQLTPYSMSLRFGK